MRTGEIALYNKKRVYISKGVDKDYRPSGSNGKIIVVEYLNEEDKALGWRRTDGAIHVKDVISRGTDHYYCLPEGDKNLVSTGEFYDSSRPLTGSKAKFHDIDVIIAVGEEKKYTNGGETPLLIMELADVADKDKLINKGISSWKAEGAYIVHLCGWKTKASNLYLSCYPNNDALVVDNGKKPLVEEYLFPPISSLK